MGTVYTNNAGAPDRFNPPRGNIDPPDKSAVLNHLENIWILVDGVEEQGTLSDWWIAAAKEHIAALRAILLVSP